MNQARDTQVEAPHPDGRETAGYRPVAGNGKRPTSLPPSTPVAKKSQEQEK